MKFGGIRWMVYSVAVVLALFPTAAAYYAVSGILDSATAVGLNPKVSRELKLAGEGLKDLARLDPSREAEFRARFDRLQETRSSYDLLLELAPALGRSYLQVFAIVFGLSLVLSLLIATWLNRWILSRHDRVTAEMLKSQRHLAYLESRESWRLFAQKLVHEVRNPLTPVQVMVGRLLGRYQVMHPPDQRRPEFESVLEETREMVNDEITKINQWIEAFSKYARMPEPRLERTELSALVDRFVQHFQDYWPNLELVNDRAAGGPDGNPVDCDPSLIREVFFNLAKNTAEAVSGGAGRLPDASQPGPVKARLRFIQLETGALLVEDDGPGLSAEVQKQLFRPYTSSKQGPSASLSRGLGLAIAKRVMLEHQGDLTWMAPEPGRSGCRFRLDFRRLEQESATP